MNARASIHAMFPLGEAATAELDKRLNDFGAETIRKGVNGASIIHHACRRGPASCNGCQVRADILDVLTSVADVIAEKATAPAGAATPEFFQPGRTYLYTRLRWKFRCDAVTSHPDTGKRVAVGYSHFGHGAWQTGDLSEDIWAEGGWTDATEAGEPRG